MCEECVRWTGSGEEGAVLLRKQEPHQDVGKKNLSDSMEILKQLRKYKISDLGAK